jgi:DNA-binding transcriptional MerR regulator
MEKSLPPIPAKRYFTIGEVGELCDVKPHVLRYWEQEFTQLRPVKRRGNRRYYQHHEVLMIRRISDLLYAQGFTISGARNQLQESLQAQRDGRKNAQLQGAELDVIDSHDDHDLGMQDALSGAVSALRIHPLSLHTLTAPTQTAIRNELLEIRDLLGL